MAVTTLAILALAFSLDLLVGNPRDTVAPLGQLVDRIAPETGERRGLGTVLVGSVLVAILAGGAVALSEQQSAIAASVVAAVVLFLTIDLRALLEGTSATLAAVDHGLNESDEQPDETTSGSVTTALPQRRMAALEDGADGLSTGFLATLLPFSLLAPASVTAATAVAAWVQCVLVLDRSGDADDRTPSASGPIATSITWITDRIGAVCIAVAAGDPAAIRRASRDRRASASPIGWPAATLAATLSVRVEASGAETDASNANTTEPSAEHGQQGVALLGLAAAVGVVVATVLAMAGALVVGPPEPVLLAVEVRSAAFEWSLVGVSNR
ncbi:cobalamin biosynthesis protein [Halobacteria archaeon AArc-dxtr1]|nr:cobalamin biosynthesis protein [Halobacteria archaeon AArc-dxtr1]